MMCPVFVVMTNALFMEQLSDLVPRMVVLVVVVGGADRQAGLQMGKEFLGGKAVVGTVMSQDHDIRFRRQDR
jgi:hypothetical protein